MAISTDISIWHNDHPTAVAKFKLQITHGVKVSGTARGTMAQIEDIVIEPGKSVKLPSEFDTAIQVKDENGIVIRGKCPWLRKEGDPKPVLEKSIDWITVDEEKQLEAEIKRLHLEDVKKQAEILRAANAKKKV